MLFLAKAGFVFLLCARSTWGSEQAKQSGAPTMASVGAEVAAKAKKRAKDIEKQAAVEREVRVSLRLDSDALDVLRCSPCFFLSSRPRRSDRDLTDRFSRCFFK